MKVEVEPEEIAIVSTPVKFSASENDLFDALKELRMKLAKEAGATYKIDKLVLVNTEILDKYLESFRVPGDSY